MHDIVTNNTLDLQTNILTMLGDLHVGSLSNITGVLRLAGYALEIDNISTGFLVATATNLGKIDATNGSTLDLNTTNTTIHATAYPAILLNETTDLILRNVS